LTGNDQRTATTGPDDADDGADHGADPPATAQRPRRPRRSRRRRIIGVIVALFVLWVVLSGLTVLLAARHVQQGADQVQTARGTLSADGLLSGAPLNPLREAEASFSSAHSLLSSPLLWPVDVLPVVGRQLRSVQDLSTAAGQVSRTGVATVNQSRALLKLPHTAGPDRIKTLQRLARLASTTHTALNSVDLGPSNALIGPLARQRTKFATELSQVQTTLARTSAAVSAAVTILKGPQNYLLLAANNAEMRSGSGDFLEAGVIDTSNGNLHLSGMQPTPNLLLPEGAVPVKGDLEARWGFLEPGVDWRNLGLTPQFDVNGALAARMWKANTGQQVDGVMALDVTGLQELLTVTGPVTLPGGTVVTSKTVDQLLLHDEYATASDNTTRVNELGTLATAVMHSLETEPLGLHATVDALASATAGRHLMLWSADPATEKVWRTTGVSGELHGDSLVSDVINRGGNKLDQYLSVGNTLTLTPQNGRTEATLTVTLANHTPGGQVAYIAGPYPGLGTTYGQYLGIVTVNLPDDVSDLSLGTGEQAVVDGPEGPSLVVGVNVSILAGATQTVTFHFSLPQEHGQLTVVPSTRIPPETWNAGGTTFTDEKSHVVTW
jgi:Protein of unknown function (DUF4012)